MPRSVGDTSQAGSFGHVILYFRWKIEVVYRQWSPETYIRHMFAVHAESVGARGTKSTGVRGHGERWVHGEMVYVEYIQYSFLPSTPCRAVTTPFEPRALNVK